MDMKHIKLNIKMSPRALDELRGIYQSQKCSKYQLPLILFSKEKEFESDVSVVDGMVWINVLCDGVNILLKGKIEENNFFCQSIRRGTVTNGRKLMVGFAHENNEEIFNINPELKKRIDLWYDYIGIMLKKSHENTYVFIYEETVSRSGDKWLMHVAGNCDSEIKNLNVAPADENGDPLYSFGRAEKLDNGILTVRTDSKSVVSLSEGVTRLAVYDAASLITCRRMKSGLDKLCKGDAVNKRLTEFLFDTSAANKEPDDNIILSENELLMKNMNTEQLAAVEGVLNSKDMYLIQGPPGTGKTTVIAEICYQNAVRGKKTLVVSQSNLAVDNAISRVMNHSEVRVLRKGDSSRVEDEGLPFVEDNVVRTWIKCVSQSAQKMADDINAKLSVLKKYKMKLPEILRYAEDVKLNAERKENIRSQLFFLKNVLAEASENKNSFFELINEAYEQESPVYAYDAKHYYPSDFRIPNNIYNDVEEKFADIESAVEKIHELESEFELLNEYTAKFTRQMRFIDRHVSTGRLENTAYEGIFYFIDEELAENLFMEGEKIISSIPYGVKALFFRIKWGKVAAIHYRRAESFLCGIQRRTIKLAHKIFELKGNEDFVQSMETFKISLDALCQDYESQYYMFRAKYDTIVRKLENVSKDYDYSVELLREKTSDKFFSAALENMSVYNPELCEIEKAVNEYYSRKAVRYLKWQKLLNEWCRRIGSDGMDYSALKQLYIDNANVIGITCIQSGTADFEKNYPSFDVVIIDESSKSTLPDMILPMLRGKKIVLVGDHKQLPPYIDSDAYDEVSDDDGRLHELMKVSLFEELYESAPHSMKTMLFRQYRMHRDIASLINQFYINTDAGRLESPSEASKAHCCQGEDISENDHVLWYNIPNAPEYYESRQNKSYYNLYEAETIKKILEKLNNNLKNNKANKTIGVITFYDAQVKILEDRLINSGFTDCLDAVELRIGSVDRFQGMEEDIILISFVRNNDRHNIGFAKDCRRINVALSRAKELLVIIGSSENFTGSSDSSAASMFQEIFDITSKLGGLRDPGKLPESKIVPVPHRNIHSINLENTVLDGLPLNEQSQNSQENINILDYFILKAAEEFDGMKLTVGNISNALGISGIFVKNRVKHLVINGYISCEGGVIKIKK